MSAEIQLFLKAIKSFAEIELCSKMFIKISIIFRNYKFSEIQLFSKNFQKNSII